MKRIEISVFPNREFINGLKHRLEYDFSPIIDRCNSYEISINESLVILHLTEYSELIMNSIKNSITDYYYCYNNICRKTDKFDDLPIKITSYDYYK